MTISKRTVRIHPDEKCGGLFSAAVLTLCFLSLMAGLRNLFSVILQTNMLNYQMRTNPSPFAWEWCLLGLLPLFSLLYKGWRKDLARWRMASLPLLLLAPVSFFLNGNFFSMPLTLLVFGWTAFRFVSLYGGSIRKISGLRARVPKLEPAIPWLVALLYLGAASWGFHMQYHAYRSFFLCYADWGIYTDAYMKLAYAGGSPGNWLSSGLHWNPGVNLLMALLMRVCPLPEFIFILNAAIVYSAAPLAYLLCRKCSLSRGYALFFAVAAVLNPVFSNQSLSLFYGFHPVNFMIPLLLCFFLFRETGNRIGMGIMFGLSLLVQETVLIFWLGYGICLLFSRRRIAGTLLILFSLSFFLLLIAVVLPRIAGGGTYSQTVLFEKLGNTPGEVLLSPLHRPKEFWTVFFQRQNFAFLLTLLTPFFFCVWLFPALMIAVVPLFAGIWIRPSADVKNVVLWYGVEITTLLLALSAVNLRRILDGGRSVLPGLLNLGLKKRVPRRVIAAAAVSATLLTVLGSYYCFAMTAYFGKYSFRRIAGLPDGAALIREIKAKIPEQSRVLATMRLRGHFLLDYPTESFSVPRKTGDVLVLDLTDRNFDPPEDLERIRREIAADRRIVPLLTIPWHLKQFVVFLVGETPMPKVSLPKMSIPEFDRKSGQSLPSDDPHFAVRCFHDGSQYLFFVQVRETPDYDTNIAVAIQKDFGVIYRTFVFGFGLFPAYASCPGSVFTFSLPAPPASGQVSVQFLKRPFSEKPLPGKEKKETSVPAGPPVR